MFRGRFKRLYFTISKFRRSTALWWAVDEVNLTSKCPRVIVEKVFSFFFAFCEVLRLFNSIN